MSDEVLERGRELRSVMFEGIDRSSNLPADVNDSIVRYIFGEIWSRPALDLRSRSCVTIAMLIALNRLEELAVHFKVGLNNGLSPEELTEICLHAAGYCGAPAAADAFRVLNAALA